MVPARDKPRAAKSCDARDSSMKCNSASAVKIGLTTRLSPWLGRYALRFPRLNIRMASDVTQQKAQNDAELPSTQPHKKLLGRQFYESIGSPKYIVAPMVDRSEFVSLQNVIWKVIC